MAGGSDVFLLIRHTADQSNPRRQLGQQFDRASQRPHRVRRVLCLFEAHGRVVRSFNCDDVLRTLDAWKFALSSTNRLGPAPIADSLPPITPAIATGPFASAITEIRLVSE
jgi:hypothetical protein